MAMSKLSTQHSEQSPLLQRAESRLSSPSFVPIDIAPVPESISACSSKHSGSKNSSCKHGSSCSLASADGSGNIGTCRICLEQETVDSQDPNNPLISPCHCSGGSKFVHRHCLQQWRQTAHRADAYYQCEVCKYRWEIAEIWLLRQLLVQQQQQRRECYTLWQVHRSACSAAAVLQLYLILTSCSICQLLRLLPSPSQARHFGHRSMPTPLEHRRREGVCSKQAALVICCPYIC